MERSRGCQSPGPTRRRCTTPAGIESRSRHGGSIRPVHRRWRAYTARCDGSTVEDVAQVLATLPWERPGPDDLVVALAALDDELRPSWQHRGLCRSYPVDLWFPERSEHATAAKALCAQCPVEAQCRAWAISQPALLGVAGGLSAEERQRLRRQARQPAEPPVLDVDHGRAGYRRGCRCPTCRAAIAERSRAAYRRRMARRRTGG